jgi:hypothetical protein
MAVGCQYGSAGACSSFSKAVASNRTPKVENPSRRFHNEAVKLCRFVTSEDPRPRAGIFHDGKIYETDGEKALGVHAPEAVELLTPIGHAASLRLFSSDGTFVYGNAGAIGPPEFSVLFSETGSAGCDVFLGCVLGGSDRDCSLEEASALVLGYTVLVGFSDGRPGYGPGSVLGPFVVTPDELEGSAVLKARLHLGEDVVANAEVSLRVFPELIRAASKGCDLREGDIIAAGPMPGLVPDRPLRDGDVVIAVIEKLGALAATVRM